MKRLIAPLAIGMVVLYAVLAIGAACCLFLHAEQPQAHHHSPVTSRTRRCVPGPVRPTPLSPFMPVFHLASSLLWSLYCDGTAPRHKRASFPL